jgi:hypothetical protein
MKRADERLRYPSSSNPSHSIRRRQWPGASPSPHVGCRRLRIGCRGSSLTSSVAASYQFKRRFLSNQYLGTGPAATLTYSLGQRRRFARATWLDLVKAVKSVRPCVATLAPPLRFPLLEDATPGSAPGSRTSGQFRGQFRTHFIPDAFACCAAKLHDRCRAGWFPARN